VSTDEPSQEHRPDGLDLAKNLARATARSSPAKRVRRSRRLGGTERRTGPARSSGAFPDDRDPQLLDATVSRLVDDHGWDVDLRVAGMFARWPELVGDEVARHATPESFADGTLVVRTDSTAWATQLKLLAPAVVKRLNEDLGHGTVTLIEVVGPHLPSWKKGPRSVRDGRGPRDTYG
jgi:predicted nucleic acid-binding Zn ribbon protein